MSDNKRRFARITVFMIAFMTLSLIFGYGFYLYRGSYENISTAVYVRSYEGLISNISEINAAAGNADYTAMRESAADARRNASYLPLGEGDFAMLGLYLRDVRNSEFLESESLARLREYSDTLFRYFVALRSEVYGKRGFERTDFDLPEYSPVINVSGDGEEAAAGNLPRDTKKIDEISREEAEKMASALIGRSVNLRYYKSNTEYPALYSFMCGNAYAEYTIAGGLLYRALIEREVGDACLSREECIKEAKRFLEENGYSGFEPVSDVLSEGAMIIEFAYGEGTEPEITIGVTVDKAKVCLFSAENYYQ